MKTNKKAKHYLIIFFSLFVLLSIFITGVIFYFLIIIKKIDIDPIYMLASIPISIIFISPLGYLVFKSLTKEFREINNQIDNLANGDYQSRINLNKCHFFSDTAKNMNKLATELNNVETLKENFINDFSHEFKTPISSINGFANLLIERDFSKSDQIKYLHIIASESSRLSKLSENTLLINKLDNMVESRNMEKLNITKSIGHALSIVNFKVIEKNINIINNLIDFYSMVDDALLLEVWINILNNAIKFTPQNGKIIIENVIDNNFSIIYFKNNGPLFSDDELSKMFNRFYQGDTSHKTEGNGLGMTIASRIIKLHNGEINASNINNYATIEVKLPITHK